MKNYLSIKDIDSLPEWVSEARKLKKNPTEFKALGQGKTVCLLFFNNSLRTRLSTQKAAMNLGLEVMIMNFGSEGWQLEFEDGFQILNVYDILYCKADDNYTEIYLENKKILVSKTLKYFEEALSEFAFARIHKSYLVNVNEVVKYKKGKGGSVVVSNGKELLVSSSKKKDLLAYF